MCPTQVFQAAALVVADRSITSGVDFWSVSVTAEKLIRMLQVPPHLLGAWLASRRAEGYTCVGCEQTVSHYPNPNGVSVGVMHYMSGLQSHG